MENEAKNNFEKHHVRFATVDTSHYYNDIHFYEIYVDRKKTSFLKDRLCHVLVFMQEPNTKGIEPAFLFEV